MIKRIICPKHGVVQEIEMDAMYLNGPPQEYHFCPYCGKPTTVDTPSQEHQNVWIHKKEDKMIDWMPDKIRKPGFK